MDLGELLKPAGKQRDRQGIGQRLAGAILGRKVDLRPDGNLWDRQTRQIIVDDGDVTRLVDPDTGELGDAVGPRRAINYAYLLARAGEDRNHVAGTMGQGDAPDWQGGTALFKPSLRIDPNYAESMRRRSRKEAKERSKAMQEDLPHRERLAQRQGYTWRLGWKLLTLTFPHPPGMDTMTQLRLFNGAFRRLTKMDLWRKVWGGVKGVEDRLTAAGSHVHGHLLLLMRYIDRDELRRAWKACLEAQAEALELAPLEWKGDGLPSVDLRRVTSSRNQDAETITPEAALDEVSKYITKTTDLLEPHPTTGQTVGPDTLIGLCDVRRWPRMFELLGHARREAPTPKAALLDTSCISAAGPRVAPPISDENGNQDAAGRSFQWHLERVTGATWNEWGPVIAYELAPDDPEPPPKERARETWRDLMDRMTLVEWCRMIDARAERAAKFRLRQLQGIMPRLYLVNLAGEVVANQNLAA